MNNEDLNYPNTGNADAYLSVQFYKGFHEGEEADFIKIDVPGDKTISIDTLATPEYKARFRRQYDAYANLREQTGTPLEQWSDIPDGFKKELNYQGFRTIEQIATAPDAAFTKIMGGTDLRRKAQAYLNRGKVNADVIIKQQQEQINELSEKMAILMEALNEKPKRGRPPATQEE